jgi:predicted P-loop ATPase
MPSVSPVLYTDSSISTPCPVCSRTHDDGCQIADDGKTVLCRSKAHNGQVPVPPDEVGEWRFTGKINGDGVLERAVYVKVGASMDGKDGRARPRADHTYYYPTADGQPAVRVRRIDDGDGKKIIWQECWIDDERLASCRTGKAGELWVKVSNKDVKSGKASKEQRLLYESYRNDLMASVHLYRVDEALALHRATGRPLLIVEGEAGVDALLALKLPATTAIGGAKKFSGHYGSANYSDDLKPFGGHIVICPDCDEDGREHANQVQFVLTGLGVDAKWLYANPEHPRWAAEVWQGGYDVKDWVSDGATAAEVLAAIGPQKIGAPKNSATKQMRLGEVGAESGSEIKAKLEDLEPGEHDNKPTADYKRIKRELGHRLKYNEMAGTVELDGEAINLDGIRLTLMIDYQMPIKSGNEDTSGIVLKIAKQSSYHPVKDYLDIVYQKHGDSTLESLRCFADRYFGQSDPIYTIFAVRFLIASVARIYDPGCKHDNALILQGRQGWGKSTFFKKLAGDAWFDDSLGSLNDKDEKLKLNQTWFMEWAELETVFKRKDVSQTKQFLSSSADKVRPPYGRSVIDMPRRSVIVGTTNQDEFLNDSTGNRRFWVIPLAKRVPIGELIENRDRIWAAAVSLYRSGKHWHLWQAEEDAADAIAQNFQSSDTWQSYVAEYVEHLPQVQVSSILENCLEMEKSRQDKAAQMRVADILRELGWKNTRKRINGVPTRCWEPIVQRVQPDTDQVQRVGNTQSLENSDLYLLLSTVPTSKEDLYKREREDSSPAEFSNVGKLADLVVKVGTPTQNPDSARAESVTALSESVEHLDGAMDRNQFLAPGTEPVGAGEWAAVAQGDDLPAGTPVMACNESGTYIETGHLLRIEDEVQPDGSVIKLYWIFTCQAGEEPGDYPCPGGFSYWVPKVSAEPVKPGLAT